ncbi:hypothetical protein [Scardovia inopinata]|uniref:hypothetical protein n=1 Tax=Scardovia inopinata TaxID=78259 RepID=UPI001C6155B4|nr:hypothetical protein [Scardovia inopinata]
MILLRLSLGLILLRFVLVEEERILRGFTVSMSDGSVTFPADVSKKGCQALITTSNNPLLDSSLR